MVFDEGGGCLSRLFDFAGGTGMGYSQPEPLLSKNKVALPPNLMRKELPRWPRFLSQKWLGTIRGCQEEILVLILDFIL